MCSSSTMRVGGTVSHKIFVGLEAFSLIDVTAIGDVVLPTAVVDDVIATMYDVSIGITIR